MTGLPTSSPAPAGATAPTSPASWWEDFIDIFYAPSQVFARRENSGFAIPMLVVTLLVALIAIANSGVMQPIMDAEFARATAAAMMAKGRSFGEAIAKFGAFILLPVAMFLTGLVLWLVGKLFDAKQSLGA